MIDKARLYPGFLLQLVRDLSNRYALAEVKLNKLLNLLPLSKRKVGLVILTCWAVTKVRKADETLANKSNSLKLDELLELWGNPDQETRSSYEYTLKMNSFRDFFKSEFKKQGIHNRVNAAQ